jgi:hypothetical protein
VGINIRKCSGDMTAFNIKGLFAELLSPTKIFAIRNFLPASLKPLRILWKSQRLASLPEPRFGTNEKTIAYP